MNRLSLFFLIFVTVLLVGCAATTPVKTTPSTTQQADNVGDVDSMGSDLNASENEDQGLDTNDLNGLDKDLSTDF